MLFERLIATIGFGLCILAAVLVIVISKQKFSDIIPITKMLDRLMTNRAIRITILIFWWWLGWHFFVAAPLYFIK
jgi:hypothetical protein